MKTNERINQLASRVNVIRVSKSDANLTLIEKLAIRRAERKNVEQEKVSLADRLAVRRAERKSISFDDARKSIASSANSSAFTKTKTRASKSEKHDCVAYIERMIERAQFTHREILELACNAFSHLSVKTVSTYLSDSKNLKYYSVHKFDRVTLTDSSKILHY